MTMARGDLPVGFLERFVSVVLEAKLDQKTKEDALKVMGCLQYVRDNLSLIHFAVDNPKAEGLYRNSRDQRMSVLRDPQGVSFHLNSYKSGLEAEKELSKLIQQVESVLRQLSLAQWLSFANQLRYDEHVGCLEARIGSALEWAMKVLSSSVPRIEDLMQSCYEFATTLDFPQRVKGYCDHNNYSVCLHQEKEKPITVELLQRYAREIGIWDGLEEKEKPVEADNTATFFLSARHVTLGKQGRVQYHFKDLNDAETFVRQLKQYAALRNLGIDKANVTRDACDHLSSGHCHVVRLNSVQFDVLFGKKSYSVLLYYKDNRDYKNKRQKTDYAESIVNNASAAVINHLLIMPEGNLGRAFTLLHAFIVLLAANTFILLIKKASTHAINTALVVRHVEDWTALHIAAHHLPADAFIALIEKADAHAVNTALVVRNKGGWTALHIAARYLPANAFITLIEKANAHAINTALVVRNEDGLTALHTAARYLPADAFIALIEKADTHVINTALVVRCDEGWTALHTAARHLPADAFIALIEKADAHAINTALVVRNKGGWTALHIAAHHLPANAFSALIEKADAHAVNTALVVRSEGDWTALHAAARNLPADAFIALIEKADAHAINTALVVRCDEGWTPLHIAARYLPVNAFSKLIQRASKEALSKACLQETKEESSILDLVLSYQSPALIAELLNKINDNALQFLLTLPNIAPRIVSLVIRFVCQDASWQNEELIRRLFNLFPEKITDFCQNYWLTGKTLPPVLLSKLILHLEKILPEYPPEKCFELKSILNAWKKEEKEDKEERGGLKTFLGKHLELTNPQLAEMIWKEGLDSVSDYALLKRCLPPMHRAVQIADAMYRAKRLFIGCHTDFPHHKAPEMKTFPETMLIKIIKPNENGWPDLLEQLSDYSYRPVLRKKTNKSSFTHKFFHLEGRVGEYKQASAQNKQAKKYTHTKKQATTLVSRSLDTAVFGHHDLSRPLVGLLFNKDRCVIKALLTSDHGTYNREWVGTQAEVDAYAKRIKSINHTNFDEFKAFIEQCPRVNEVLAEVSLAAVVAIVIAKDTAADRQIARERRREFCQMFRMDLPIVFYDTELRILRIYSEMEQEDDTIAMQRKLPAFSFIKEREEKHLLEKVKQISESPSLRR